MITAHGSRTVGSYRESSITQPGLEVVRERDRGAFAVRTRPDLKGISHVQPGSRLDALRRGRRGIRHGPTPAASDTGIGPRPAISCLGPARSARAATDCDSRCQNRPPGSQPALRRRNGQFVVLDASKPAAEQSCADNATGRAVSGRTRVLVEGSPAGRPSSHHAYRNRRKGEAS